jgi:CheY-like chemotaxis protein
MLPVTSSQSILLVEDSPEDYEVTLRALRKAGLQNPIYHCIDGDEALDFVYQREAYDDPALAPRPGLILLDRSSPLIPVNSLGCGRGTAAGTCFWLGL